jgi:hypothetical protein
VSLRHDSAMDALKEICEIKKCDEYISTMGAKEYLGDKAFFDNSSIKIKYFSIDNFLYNQIGDKFIEKLSIIDLIFNEGPNALNIIKKKFVIL